MPFATLLKKTENGEDLSAAEARNAFDEIFGGAISADDIGAFLLALNKKGETVDELTGAVTSMRGKMIAIKAPPGTIDVCGTGGDGLNTLHISSAAALVVAACGVPVAKHGNRGVSSRSGSSDVLGYLGVKLDPTIDVQERCLKETNICFLYAPHHHPAMKNVAEIRKKLGKRTIFNLVGPLINPANVNRHLIGVYELAWLGPMAEVLSSLGSEEAWLVHGHDKMDEITTTDETDVVELRNGRVRHFAVSPENVGLPRSQPEDLKGRDTEYNAAELVRLLDRQHGPYRDIVLMNAAAALTVAGKTNDMHVGLMAAADAIDNGNAMRTLKMLIELTNGAKA